MVLPSFAKCLLAAVAGNSSLVAFPSQANYSAIVAPYNLDYPVVPSAVAFPSNATQVAALVKCAAASGSKVQAKSGGHSTANYGSSSGELSINLQNLRHFSMDQSTFRAAVGSGLLLGELDELMYNAGQRFVPHGTTVSIGIGGHGTVGGAGNLWRQYGLTIDHIQEVEVVLADARIVRASASPFEEQQAVSFSYVFNATDISSRAGVFKTWQDLAYNSSAPEELQVILAVTGGNIVLTGTYFGLLDDFNTLGISGLFSSPHTNTVKVFTNFLELSQQWGSRNVQNGRAAPGHYYTKSTIFRPETRIPNNVVDEMFRYIATKNSGIENWDIEIQAGGGQLRATSPSETAFPHRDASFVVLLYAQTNGNVPATAISFLKGLDTLSQSGKPNAYYGEYAGFVNPTEQSDKARYNYWGSNLKRLEKIKAVYDPHNVFYNKQSVLPNGKFR